MIKPCQYNNVFESKKILIYSSVKGKNYKNQQED